MASIFRRGKVWWVKYYHNGQKFSKSLKTKNERVAKARKKELEALQITGQLKTESKTPLKEAVEAFCKHLLATRTKKSAKNELSYLRTIFGQICPSLKPSKEIIQRNPKTLISPVTYLEQLSVQTISEYLDTRATVGKLSPKTVNRIREVLNGLFSFAIRRFDYTYSGQRFKHPVQAIKKRKESAPEIIFLTNDQIIHQLHVLKEAPTLHAVVATLIYAGLRREEALWLTPQDLDLENRLLRIRSKTIQVKGEGEYWQPKTKKNRSVPISKTLMRILIDYPINTKQRWVFPTPSGGRYNPDNFSRKLRNHNKNHNLNWTCLHYRHTFGSHLAQNNISLYKIAELMGNSPEICRKHYAALIPEKMHKVVEF